MIRCRPYNPKAQGKVERSHRVLRSKIYFDMIYQKRTGVNWAKNLSDYMICLNTEKSEELSWKSPFKIFFTSEIETLSTIGATQNNYRQQAEQTNNWRKSAKAADDRMAKVMMMKHARKYTYKTYDVGDRVFVRIGKKRGKTVKNYRVLIV